MAETARPKAKQVGIIIRSFAALYDLAILFALAFLVFVPITIIEQKTGPVAHWLKVLLFTTIAYAYFVGFWVRGGATTGMRPWKLRVVMAESGDPLSLVAATLRFVALSVTWISLGATALYVAAGNVYHGMFVVASALPAVSMILMLLTPRHQPLHDLMAGTNVFYVMEKAD
jgi:uncharacterized RDD family membrane protein YckC